MRRVATTAVVVNDLNRGWRWLSARGCMTRTAHAQRVHAPRRAALGAPRLHGQRGHRSGPRGRAAAGRALPGVAGLPLRDRVHARRRTVADATTSRSWAVARPARRRPSAWLAPAIGSWSSSVTPRPRWRACGVFTSPLVRARLRDLGLAPSEVAALHRPICAMELESTSGRAVHASSTGTVSPAASIACASTRACSSVAARPARRYGERQSCATCSCPPAVARNQLLSRIALAEDSPPHEAVAARVVVGADGGGSRVARAAGVLRETNWLGRAGITFHVADTGARASADEPIERALLVRPRLVRGHRARCPTTASTSASSFPRAVCAKAWRPSPTASSARSVVHRTRGAAAFARMSRRSRAGSSTTSRAWPGDGWLLVGDATGFIDPLTGEGIHRALVTAQLARRAVDGWLAGDHRALAVYDRRVRLRFQEQERAVGDAPGLPRQPARA